MTVVVENVSHRYPPLEVLRDVSLEAAPGEVLAIVGPSGCGKSTLLAMVGGLLAPSEGRVLIDAEAAPGTNPVTFVFQDFALLPWRDVRGNVAFGLEHHRLPPAERDARVDDALRRTKLFDFGSALPKQLSGGMRQRVGLARALAVRPSVLLMDEPLSALDGQTRELLMDDLAALLRGSALTVLYVTHNLDEAVRLADTVAVFSRRPGRVRQVVRIDVPRDARGSPEAAGALAAIRNTLWSIIRSEAEEADREILDA